MRNSQKAIIKTLSYADVFEYPLTASEIWRFLISSTVYSQKQIDKALLDISLEGGYYYLKGRRSIIHKRRKREKESQKKLEIAKRISLTLSIIPSVNLVGASGNLAMRNARKSDDIDFFIVAKENTLFVTRIFVVLLLKLLGRHRGKFSKNISDKICINMLVDENSLTIPPNRQNLYTAHEVVQMLPLFERTNTYKKFIAANKWVGKFLPNSISREINLRRKQNNANFTIFSLSLFEFLAKKLQLLYMRNSRSTEYVSDTMLAFHPKDYTNKVLHLYEERIKMHGI